MAETDKTNSSNDERSVNPVATANNELSELNGVASDDADTREIWDLLPLPDLYSTVVEIYRKGTSIHDKNIVISVVVCIVKDQIKMDYHRRVLLLAYYKQEKYGSYGPEKDTNTGYFDLVGSDRR